MSVFLLPKWAPSRQLLHQTVGKTWRGAGGAAVCGQAWGRRAPQRAGLRHRVSFLCGQLHAAPCPLWSVLAFETPLRLQGPARPCWSPPHWATWGLSLWPPMAGGRPRAAPSRRRYVPGRGRAGHGFDFDASACPPSRKPPPNHRDPPAPSPGSATSDARRCCVVSALRVTWSGRSDVGASVRPAPWPAVTPQASYLFAALRTVPSALWA